jgi:hypothetical protein
MSSTSVFALKSDSLHCNSKEFRVVVSSNISQEHMKQTAVLKIFEREKVRDVRDPPESIETKYDGTPTVAWESRVC